jgi:hypothetical protein
VMHVGCDWHAAEPMWPRVYVCACHEGAGDGLSDIGTLKPWGVGIIVAVGDHFAPQALTQQIGTEPQHLL